MILMMLQLDINFKFSKVLFVFRKVIVVVLNPVV